jgi:hypothetical protein
MRQGSNGRLYTYESFDLRSFFQPRHLLLMPVNPQIDIEFTLRLDPMLFRFRDPELAKVLCITEEDTRANLVHALWRYVKKRKLHDPEDITQVRLDSDELGRFFKPSIVATASLPAALDRHIVPANSIRIKYRLSFAASIAPEVFEVGVQGVAVPPPDGVDSLVERELGRIDAEILVGLEKLLGEHRRRYEFLSCLAADPVGFTRRALLSQAIDGQQVRRAALGRSRASLMTRLERRSDLWAGDWSAHAASYLAHHQPAGRRPMAAPAEGRGDRPRAVQARGLEGHGEDEGLRRPPSEGPAYTQQHAPNHQGRNGGQNLQFGRPDSDSQQWQPDGLDIGPGFRGAGQPSHAAHLGALPRQHHGSLPGEGDDGGGGGGGAAAGGFVQDQGHTRALTREPELSRPRQTDATRRPQAPLGQGGGGGGGGGGWHSVGAHERGNMQDVGSAGSSFRLQPHGSGSPQVGQRMQAFGGEYAGADGDGGDGPFAARKRPRPSIGPSYLQGAGPGDEMGPSHRGVGRPQHIGQQQHSLGAMSELPPAPLRATFGTPQAQSAAGVIGAPGGPHGPGIGGPGVHPASGGGTNAAGLHIPPSALAGGNFQPLAGMVGGAGGGSGLSAAAMEAEHVQQREALMQAHQQQTQALHAFLAPPILSTPAAPPLHQQHHTPQHLARALSAAGLDSILATPPPLSAAAAAGLQQGPLWPAAAGLPPSVPQEGQDLSRVSNMRFGAGM